MIPIAQQIAEVRRELAMRANVYPGLIARGKLRKGEADHQMTALQAALATLEWVRNHAERLKSTVKRMQA